MKKQINKVIRTLIISDFFLHAGWGLFAPFFAIFVTKNIDAIEAVKIVGFASFLYWTIKAILQIPISRYLDKRKGEKDDFWFMIFGLFLASLGPFGFVISSSAWHIYLFQIIYAIGMSFFVPSWNGIFTRHIDKGREAFEWAMDSTILGIGAGITGALGAITISIFGFTTVFLFVGGLYLLSGSIILITLKDVIPIDHVTLKRFSSKETQKS
ncbi:MAG: MFS transporter [Candidatus Nealsonbacteria bacterium]